MFLARRWDTTIVMAVHNNNDILMVHYEDLPDRDKDVIGKAIEKFQNKCLLSYTKTRDNTIIQKFLLPRVLLHGQTDTIEAEDRRFFTKIVNKSVCDAISSHNDAFLDTFHNAMKEVIHGIPVSQVESTCYIIPDPLTQGTNQVDTSHQEAAPASNDDVQAVQSSSKQAQGTTTNHIQYNPRLLVQYVQQPVEQGQNQMINFGTSGHIPSSAQKIAPSIQKIHRDIDPNIYNQGLQAANQ